MIVITDKLLNLKKYTILLLVFLVSNFFYAQIIDISAVTNLEQYKDFKKREDVSKKLGYFNYLDNAVWNTVSMKEVSFHDDYLTMELDNTVENNVSKCIAFMKSNYKNKLFIEQGYLGTKYIFENRFYKIELEVDDEEKKINEKSRGKLTINYKPQYAIPLSQISNLADEDPKEGILYYINIDNFGTNYEVFLNGILIASEKAKYRYMEDSSILLNPFIIDNKSQNIEINITPGEDEDGNPMKTISKRSYFKASLSERESYGGKDEKITKFCNYYEYVTDTIRENGYTRYSSYVGTYQYGKKSLSAGYKFVPETKYKIEAWSNAEDLRRDKELKSKIIALYQQLADVMKSKDENGFSNLLFQCYDETVTSTYNTQFRMEKLWEDWLPIIKYSYLYKVEKDFELKFSEDGKLVYAVPLKQMDMLRVIGKRIAEGFTFYMYKDAASQQLKFIRK